MASLEVPVEFDRRQHWEMAYQAVIDKIQVGESGSLEIDLGSTAFIPAEGVLALVNIARLWHRHSGEVTLLQRVQRPVLQYLERMDTFVHAAACLVVADPFPSPESRERTAGSTHLPAITPM